VSAPDVRSAGPEDAGEVAAILSEAAAWLISRGESLGFTFVRDRDLPDWKAALYERRVRP